jgi:hypothetical protein
MKTSLLAAAVALALPSIALAQSKACDLVTPEEIQATLGAKPSLKPSTLPSGVEVCSGKAGAATVTVRLYERRDSAEREKDDARLHELKKAGATVETRRVSGMECTELRPGGKAVRQPYTTWCVTPSTSRLPRYAVIEVSSPSQATEMRQLAPLAQSIASRIY